MDDLEKKYLQGEISVEELQNLRRQLATTSDEELEKVMYERWMNDDYDTHDTPFENKETVRSRIMAHVQSDSVEEEPKSWSVRISSVFRWMQIAAAILLPVLLVTAYFMYRDSRPDAALMAVTTGVGERANITLPDGTRVVMNESSLLQYSAKDFGRDTRQVAFEGEGYFEVAHDAKHPFLIDADGLNVKVLGTKFNLQVCSKEPKAELTLEEGSVLFTATQTGSCVTMKPYQKAVLDRVAGNISISDLENVRGETAWRFHELMFNKTPLHEVVAVIERTYNVKIQVDCANCMNDLFTGTIPSNSLEEDIKILEASYQIKFSQKK